MEVEAQPEVSNLAVLAAAAAEAAASADIVQPLFAEVEAGVVQPEETSEEQTSEEQTSEEASVDDGCPPEMRQWMNDIDNIEYHYRYDDDDRGYNFFRDNAGNTLMIQEFDVNGQRYLNINREHIIRSSHFFDLMDARAGPDGLKITTWGQQLLKACSTDLLVEAMTILQDTGSESESESESDSEAEAEPEPKPQPIPTSSDSEAVQRFLLSFFVVLMFIKAIGLLGQLV